MTDNERITQEIEPLLKEMTRTLATYYHANALKCGLIYKASIKGDTFTLSFIKDDKTSENMDGVTPLRIN